jgi:predicted glycosyltransferase
LPIDKAKKTIVIRLEESFASYLLGLSNKWSDDLIKGMLDRFQDDNIVVLCRYEQQLSKILESYGDKFIVPKEVVIGFNLLKNTDLFIGMGGTMTAESALMGVPTISAYQGKDTFVEDYLIRKKLIVKPHTVKGVLENVEKLMDERKRALIKRRAEELLKKMEDPIEKIVSIVKGLANK